MSISLLIGDQNSGALALVSKYKDLAQLSLMTATLVAVVASVFSLRNSIGQRYFKEAFDFHSKFEAELRSLYKELETSNTDFDKLYYCMTALFNTIDIAASAAIRDHISSTLKFIIFQDAKDALCQVYDESKLMSDLRDSVFEDCYKYTSIWFINNYAIINTPDRKKCYCVLFGHDANDLLKPGFQGVVSRYRYRHNLEQGLKKF